MIFIGIVAKPKKQSSLIKLIKQQKDLNIILIKDSNIENLQSIKFDTIFIDANIQTFKNIELLDNICKKTKYIAVNTDNNRNLEILKEEKKSVITYGLNHKCTITVSSIKEEFAMIAIQREIIKKNGKLQEIGEIKVKKNEKLDIYEYMILVICDILYGKFMKN